MELTGEIIEELYDSQSMSPALIQWTDTGEYEVVPLVLFNDISYCNRGREYELIITQEGLLNFCYECPPETDDDFNTIANGISES